MTTPGQPGDPAPAPDPAGTGAVGDLVTLLQQLSGPAPPPAQQPADTPTNAEIDADGQDASAEPMFRDLNAFMTGYLAPVVERRIAVGAGAGLPWCPQWWRHPEAITRLYALWRSWETLRVSDPDTGMSIWWRDHFDHHFGVLVSEYGPLGRCSPDRGHIDTQPLTIEPAPADVLNQLPDYEVRTHGAA
jgi:hypothetical protein